MTPERAAAIEAWVNGGKPWAGDRESPYFIPWYAVPERALDGFITEVDGEIVKPAPESVAPQSQLRSRGQNNGADESVSKPEA